MKLQWRYCISVPALPGLPLVLQEWGQPERHINLGQAREALFKAAVQGHQIITEQPHNSHVLAVIYIIEKDTFYQSYDQWLEQNKDEPVGNFKEAT